MNKAELVTVVQNSIGGDVSKSSVEKAVEAVLDGIKSGVQNDNSVQLAGFGSFSVTKRAALMGIKPRTGEKIKIAECRSVKFKPAAALKNLV